MRANFIFVISAFLAFMLFLNTANALLAYTDKITYIVNDTITIAGEVSGTSAANVTATIYNSSDIAMNSSTAASSGGTPNTFSISNLINGSYSVGDYYITVATGTESVRVNFEVVSERLLLKAHLIENVNITPINTSTTITSDGDLGGNFSELRDLSISGTLHYGNETVDGTLYHFTLVDQNLNNTYDTLYIDDDLDFRLYNDTEDNETYPEIEKVRRVGERFGDYLVGEIEFVTGNKVFLGKPVNDSVYNSDEQVNFVVLVQNSTYYLKQDPNTTLSVSLVDKDGDVLASFLNTTNEWGYFVSNFTAPSTPGVYLIMLNNTPVEVFYVEAFKLFGRITDLADNPTYSFAPNPVVRISATLKTSAGDPIDGATVSALITYPDGSTSSVSLSGANGTYYNDVDLSGSENGGYNVKISTTYSGDTQEFLMGFSIEIVSLDVIAINPQFIGEAEGPEAMVDAFAPNSNVSLLAVLSNVSAGGIMAKGPGGGEEGIIAIDNASTAADECGDRVTLVSLKDDRDVSLNTSLLNVQVMNLSSAISLLGISEGPPEQQMLRQCMIIFNSPNRTGFYKAEVKITHPFGEKTSGTTFSIQRLYATANPVDFKGDDFWFYAPNTTIRIKLKITDLSTREDLPSQNITNAKITEMYKEWPTFQDVFTQDYRAIANESINTTTGTISFTSPDSEGFFFFRFKFKVDLSGSTEESVGSGFFMLKKYIIWGEPYGCQPGQPCMIGVGKNITLAINAIDVSKGSLIDLGQSGLTCTGCDGLYVDVNELWNDQLMKRMEEGTDYLVIKGVIINSTANLTIVPADLQTGWYHVDLILTDPSNTNNTYFGFAWFEIRNFWVDSMPVTVEGGNLTASWGRSSYGINSPATFAVTAWNPPTGFGPPEFLSISSISLGSVNRMVHGPPVTLQEGEYNYTASKKTVLVEMGPDRVPLELWVVNITGLSKTGDYQANVRATTSKGSDIGSAWFDVSRYRVDLVYRGMEEWPPVFAPTENFTVNISAYNFNNSPRNLSQTGTKIKSVWDERTGRPIRVNSSTTCDANNCTLTTDLSQLGAGKYDARIVINDSTGAEKGDGVFFVVKDLIVAIPVIREVWVQHLTDTPDRKLDVGNDRDMCDNERGLLQSATPSSGNSSGTFCIRQRGEWQQASGSCDQNDLARVNVTSNGTHLWITTGDFRSGSPNVTGDNFTVTNDSIHNWTIISIGNVSEGDSSFRVKHKDGKICGSKQINCGSGGCQEVGYVAIPPTNHSTFYHGYSRNLIQNDNMGEDFGSDFNKTRDVYIYHNTTYVWLTNTTNMSSVSPVAAGGTITDPYGGQWEVKTISKNKVALTGQNVLARSGAWINTSLSKSGVIKLRSINEEELGGWDPRLGQEIGIDLNGDGLTNSTVYFAVSDNASSGVYDTFFFSTDNNFSNPISLSANRTVRTFGLSAELTLFNIAPDGKKVWVYSNRTGDWGDLGELKVGSEIKIPILVLSPNGSYETANISIKNIRKEVGTSPPQIVQPTPYIPNATITGIGEIVVNLSDVGQTEAGSYAFDITAKKGSDEERLEEWRWPFVTMRAFLTDMSVGDGGYVSGFRQLPLYRFDWESYGEIRQIYTMNDTAETAIPGVFEHTDVDTTCSDFAAPSDADANNFSFREGRTFEDVYRFGMDYTNTTVYIDPGTGCNFTEGGTIGPLSLNADVNLTLDNHTYMLQVVQISYNHNRSAFGFAGVNVSVIEPIRIEEWGDNNPSPKWGVMALNLSGTNYNIILANDTSLSYPMCNVWNIKECVKRAWIVNSSVRNFSHASVKNVTIGQNFTSDLYLAMIGPGFWEGLIIGNFSNVPEKPSVDIRIKDNTVSWFGVLNESSLALDLNKDNYTNGTFYMVTFDDRSDSLQNLTDNIVDGDLNITEEWWSDSNANSSLPGYYKDFYNNETGVKEYRSGLPIGSEWGGVRFGEIPEGVDWEQLPEWEIANYNNTDMLLRKGKWRFQPTENMTIIVRAYDFSQNAIPNANVSVEKLMSFGPFGGSLLNASAGDYSIVNVINVTDSSGWAILKLENTSWQQGEYMVQIKIESGSDIERVSNWFVVGGS